MMSKYHDYSLNILVIPMLNGRDMIDDQSIFDGMRKMNPHALRLLYILCGMILKLIIITPQKKKITKQIITHMQLIYIRIHIFFLFNFEHSMTFLLSFWNQVVRSLLLNIFSSVSSWPSSLFSKHFFPLLVETFIHSHNEFFNSTNNSIHIIRDGVIL